MGSILGNTDEPIEEAEATKLRASIAKIVNDDAGHIRVVTVGKAKLITILPEKDIPALKEAIQAKRSYSPHLYRLGNMGYKTKQGADGAVNIGIRIDNTFYEGEANVKGSTKTTL